MTPGAEGNDASYVRDSRLLPTSIWKRRTRLHKGGREFAARQRPGR